MGNNNLFFFPFYLSNSFMKRIAYKYRIYPTPSSLITSERYFLPSAAYSFSCPQIVDTWVQQTKKD